MSKGTLSQRLSDEIKAAMKTRDTTALTVLRALKSALQYAAIERHGADGELDEAEALGVVRKQIKQRQDSIASFEQAGRAELAANELAEIAVLERYLPAALDEAEVAAIVDACIAEVGATSRKEMGEVMKRAQQRVAGRTDNKVISRLVMQRLG